MAEESPQSSSKPQETSKDSGVSSEGQLSNPTGENTAVQNNQKFQEVTKQNSQGNKKYDLGVLFVHGIGKQKPGDTFETMFWPIKNKLEEILAQNLSSGSTRIIKGYYKATKRNCLKTDTSLTGLDVELQDSGNCKNIAFRESYWHEKNINNQDINFLDNIKIIQAGLRLFFLKILQPRMSTILFIIFIGFMLRSLGTSSFLSIFNDDGLQWSIVAAIFGLLTLPLIALIIMKIPEIRSLWGQIKISKLGYASNYIKVVSRDINLIMNESRNVLIISHSMGGYLAYKTLAQINGYSGKIYFVGMGSGLGPMSIVEYDNRDEEGSIFGYFVSKLRTNTLVYLTLFALLFVELVTLWFNLALFFSCRWDNGSILFTHGLSGNPILMCIFINVAMILLVYITVFMFLNSEFKLGNLGKDGHYEFYYPADLVGNTSRFVYSRDTNNARVGGILGLSAMGNISKRVIFAHDMGYYMKNDIVVGSSSRLVGVGAGVQNFSLKDIELDFRKNYHKYQIYWAFYIFFGIYGFQTLIDTFKENHVPIPFYAVIYSGPMLVFLEYVSYFILGHVFKTLIHLYFLKVDFKSRLRRAFLFLAIDFLMIVLIAPSLFVNVYGRPGFVSNLALFVGAIFILTVIIRLIKWVIRIL